MRHEGRIEVGDVWRDDQEHMAGGRRTVTVERLSDNGQFGFVVASPSGRRTRIHVSTLTNRFTLLTRTPPASPDSEPGGVR